MRLGNIFRLHILDENVLTGKEWLTDKLQESYRIDIQWTAFLKSVEEG